MFDPRGRKGPWTAKEDDELIRCVPSLALYDVSDQ